MVEEVRHLVALAGRVTDAATGQPVAGAQVAITTAPQAFTDRLAPAALGADPGWAALAERPDRTLTRADGSFWFIDLPDGSYGLTAGLPASGARYGTVNAAANVARDAQGGLKPVLALLAIPPTQVGGTVQGPDQKPLLLAEIRMLGSGERALTDAAGAYRLLAVEPGTRTVEATAPGCRPLRQTVQLAQPGSASTLAFVLTAA